MDKKYLNEDIDTVLNELARLQADIDELFIKSPADNFIKKCGNDITEMLDELKHWREASGAEGSSRTPYRSIVEGYSETSGQDALAQAMEKASHFFSEDHDVSITLQQLIALPKGGHRAVMVVHVVPMTLKYKPHIKSADVEKKRQHARVFYADKKFEAEHLRKVVYDHFAERSGGVLPPIPEFVLIEMNEANILNHMLEKQFLAANLHMEPAHKKPDTAPAPGFDENEH
jgi:hypothetical protein